MASKMSTSKCEDCRGESGLSRSCAVCNAVLCYECAPKYDPQISNEAFEKKLYYICPRKCNGKNKENNPHMGAKESFYRFPELRKEEMKTDAKKEMNQHECKGKVPVLTSAESGSSKELLAPEQDPLTDKENQPDLTLSIEQRLEKIRRDIEYIALITRAEISKRGTFHNRAPTANIFKGRFERVPKSFSKSTIIQDRIQSVQNAIRACQATTGQMRETTMEDIRVSLEGKVRCLLKIWKER